MAIAATYQYGKIKVIVHDDCILPEKERQELVERLFRYEEEACARAYRRKEEACDGGI